ncbi:hypothetical protein J6590_068961 [Homalodisca vitripennis]|nr:hypothetical protein J6590_068961 [Homalodisca vitripennis]
MLGLCVNVGCLEEVVVGSERSAEKRGQGGRRGALARGGAVRAARGCEQRRDTAGSERPAVHATVGEPGRHSLAAVAAQPQHPAVLGPGVADPVLRRHPLQHLQSPRRQVLPHRDARALQLLLHVGDRPPVSVTDERAIIDRCLFLPSGPGLGWLPTRCDLQMTEAGRSTPSLSLQSSTTMRSVFSPVVSSTPKMRRFWRRWNCSSSSQRPCSWPSISSSRWVKVPTCSRSLATSSPMDASAVRTASSTTPFSSWVMRVTSRPKMSPEKRCFPTRSAMTVASTLAALSVPVEGIVGVVERPGSDVTDKERSDRRLSAPPDNGTGSPLDPDLSCGGDRYMK